MLEMFKAFIFTLFGEHRAEDTKYQNTTLSTIKMQPWSLMKFHPNHSVWQRLGCLEGGRMHQNTRDIQNSYFSVSYTHLTLPTKA